MSSTERPHRGAALGSAATARADFEALIERYASERFVRSPGPGGQNVNKVATAVELRFDLAGCPLPEELKDRLRRLAGRRLNQRGQVVIAARRHRERERNRADARARLAALLEQAAVAPRTRRATRPSAGAKARRRADKAHRAHRKGLRSRVGDE